MPITKTYIIPKLVTKIFIKGRIICKTGLRIGGNKSSLEIGGVDLNIIKSSNGVPYIPGSSIKGKLRSLLAKVRGYANADADNEALKNLFGGGGGKENKSITRLFVRDAFLMEKHFTDKFPHKNLRDFNFSEVKTENRIDRSSGKAEHPRQIERVPAEAEFELELMLDFYEGDDRDTCFVLLNESLHLLALDYLGGHGSRGSGKVEIIIDKITGKNISEKGIEDVKGSPWGKLERNFTAKDYEG